MSFQDMHRLLSSRSAARSLQPEFSRTSFDNPAAFGQRWIRRSGSAIPATRAASEAGLIGKNLLSAFYVGTLVSRENPSGHYHRFDAVGSANPMDFYAFDLETIGTLDVQVSGLTSNASLHVLRDVNRNFVVDPSDIIATSDAPGSAAERVTLQGLTRGRYFVAIRHTTSLPNTPYQLTVAGQAGLGIEQGTTDSWLNAYQLGQLNGERYFQGKLNRGVDDRDYYTFKINTPTHFDAQVTSFSDLADLNLVYDANNNGRYDRGEFLIHSNEAEWLLHRQLQPGTYFLEVTQRGSASLDYTLNISGIPVSDFQAPTMRDVTVRINSVVAHPSSFGKQDYYARVKIGDFAAQDSPVIDNRSVTQPNWMFSRRFSASQQHIPITISLYDDVPFWWDTPIDINPDANSTSITLFYNTLTNQLMKQPGNDPFPRAVGEVFSSAGRSGRYGQYDHGGSPRATIEVLVGERLFVM